MKALRLLLASFFLMALFSCSFKPVWDLGGKWKQVDGKQAIEFLQKGKVKLYSDSFVCEANYSFVNKDHFKIMLGDFGSIVVAFKVKGKDLTITTKGGKTLKFKKIAEKETVHKEKTLHKVEEVKKHAVQKEHLTKEKVKHQQRTEQEMKHQPEHHG